jgi:hypothetical protein
MTPKDDNFRSWFVNFAKDFFSKFTKFTNQDLNVFGPNMIFATHTSALMLQRRWTLSMKISDLDMWIYDFFFTNSQIKIWMYLVQIWFLQPTLRHWCCKDNGLWGTSFLPYYFLPYYLHFNRIKTGRTYAIMHKNILTVMEKVNSKNRK